MMKKATVVVLVVCLSIMAGLAVGQSPAPSPDPGLTIARMEIAGGVENREPVDVSVLFPATQERVYCFLEFINVPAETSVNVVWTLGLNEMARVPLTIKPFSKYRTWAYKTIGGMKGDWKVDVIDASGNLLKSAAFKVE